VYNFFVTLRGRPRVLVVEDDDLTRLTLREGLSRDYEVVECADGASAMDALASRRSLSVALVDVRLPDASGLTILKEARKRRPRLPVVLMTAFADAATEEDVRAAGGRALLMKPVLLGPLRELLRRLL
jgi:two-component system response regulator AtoC